MAIGGWLDLRESGGDCILQLVHFGEAALCLLRVDEVAIDLDLEGAGGAGDEGERGGLLGELGEEFLGRPRGPCGVVSGDAVFDGDREVVLHHGDGLQIWAVGFWLLTVGHTVSVAS